MQFTFFPQKKKEGKLNYLLFMIRANLSFVFPRFSKSSLLVTPFWKQCPYQMNYIFLGMLARITYVDQWAGHSLKTRSIWNRRHWAKGYVWKHLIGYANLLDLCTDLSYLGTSQEYTNIFSCFGSFQLMKPRKFTLYWKFSAQKILTRRWNRLLANPLKNNMGASTSSPNFLN